MTDSNGVSIRSVNDYLWKEIDAAMSVCNNTYVENIRHGKNARMVIRAMTDQQSCLSATFFNKRFQHHFTENMFTYIDRYKHACDEMKNIICEIFLHINHLFYDELPINYNEFLWGLFEIDMRILDTYVGTGATLTLCSEDSIGNVSTMRKEALKRAQYFMESMDIYGLARIMNNDHIWRVVCKYPHMHAMFVKFVQHCVV